MSPDSFGWNPPSEFDDFIVEKPLGKGAMGWVYLAHDKHLDRPVALKFIASLAPNSTERKRFLVEARSAARLNHPNVVTIYRVGEVDGKLYLASEFIQGTTLDKINKPLPWQEVVRIGKELARGLSAAHKAGVLHRDIKPANAIRTEDGTVKLLDFGLAKVFSDQHPSLSSESEAEATLIREAAADHLPDTVPPKDAGRTAHGEEFDQTFDSGIANITRPGTVMGTPYYMAPELWTGAAATPQSDIYALAALLYELMTGLPPSHALLSEGDVQKLRTEALPSLAQKAPHVPPRLAEIIDQCLRINLEERPTSGNQLIEQLDELPRDTPFEALFSSSDQNQDRRTNLPDLSSGIGVGFIGRRRELQALQAKYATSRCLTVRGTAGTGKTRFASYFALGKVQEYASTGGTWFCDLQSCRTLDEFCANVAEVLQVSVSASRSSTEIVELLGRAMEGRGPLLLVLDNFEQLVEYARETVSVWLRLAPETKFLLTSRSATRIVEETVYDLMPLSVPSATDTDPALIARAEAVQLFMERARAAARHWIPSENDAAIVSTLVRKLDGIPLAVELCAARAAILKPAQMLERLERRFALLRDTSRSPEDRQATLVNTIEWSWNLLDPHEQAALAQCAVFRGGFSLDAAENILSAEGLDAPATMDLLQALQEKSLIHSQRSSDGSASMRFALFESIREFAGQKLKDTGTQSKVESRHAQFFVTWGERLASASTGPHAVEELAQMSIDLDNLSEVVVRMAASSESVLSVRAALAANAYLEARASPTLQLANLQRAPLDSIHSPELAARLHLAIGHSLNSSGKFKESEVSLQRALAFAATSQHSVLQSHALTQLANLHSMMADRMPEALREIEQATQLAEPSTDDWLKAFVRGNQGNVEFRNGRPHAALKAFRDARDAFRALGDLRYQSMFTHNTAGAFFELGRLDEAIPLLEEAYVLQQQLKDNHKAGVALQNIALLLLYMGRGEEAKEKADVASKALRGSGDRFAIALLEGTLGFIYQSAGELEQSVTFLERSARQLEEVHATSDKLLMDAVRSSSLALLGQVDDARELLSKSREQASEGSEPGLICTLDVLRGVIEATSHNDEEAQRCRLAAFAPSALGSTFYDSSANVRFAVSILDRALSSPIVRTPQHDLPRQTLRSHAEKD